MSNIRESFQQQVTKHKAALHEFLQALEQAAPPALDLQIALLEKDVWAETDCLACANCCRSMSPTYTAEDVRRIATHFRMTARAFRQKWLYQTKTGALMNRTQPCQFLDLSTNKCTIYAIRPADCAGFPHLGKQKFVEYLHVHKQNLEYCPATFKLVKKLLQAAEDDAALKKFGTAEQGTRNNE